ncbi:MAG: hypothetical protein A2020_01920 [Lentisphaerae bacterium GWF2_45_14]|nr:MAG: hypothetical protein A2020_01920 [Lentisphaerae bacterium GWF2_45_14]
MAKLLKDIAARARVTSGTASRALSGKSGVSESKRLEILRLAEEMSYVPNRQASSLRTGMREGLTIVSPLFGYNSIGSIRNQVLYKKASKTFANTVMLMKNPSTPIYDFLKTAVSGSCQHLIIHGLAEQIDESCRKLLEQSKVHIVSMDGKVEGFDSVRIFRENGVFQAVRLLLLSGCKNIFFIAGGSMENPTDRLRGAIAAFDSMKLSKDLIRLVPLRKNEPDDMFAAGFETVDELLNSRAPDALFCSNDEVAIGALAAIRKKGLRVPEDIKVTGFDDIPESKYMSPPLTTVGQPLDQMVSEVIRICLKHGGLSAAGESVNAIFPTNLIVRDSAPITDPSIRNEVFRKLETRDIKI